ncbi:MAG: Carboxymethylenebutenolidase [Chloroflexi bacterium]|nr:Carboxymethylenebutenolidase [Chloroflexota bacterium]
MGVVTDWIVLDTATGPMRMYIARPEGGTAGPGILVIQEIFGLTEDLQATCRRFAEEGFVALAPEIYHAQPVRLGSYDDVAAAMKIREQMSDDQVLDDLNSAFRLLAARGEVRSGLVGALGFCAGGRDAFMLGTRNPDVMAVICFYGSLAPDDSDAPINDAAKLAGPSLIFYGEDDRVVPIAQADRVRDELTRLGKDFEIVTYPNAGHGFMNAARARTYVADVAAEAWTRTIDFLYEKLEG